MMWRKICLKKTVLGHARDIREENRRMRMVGKRMFSRHLSFFTVEDRRNGRRYGLADTASASILERLVKPTA